MASGRTLVLFPSLAAWGPLPPTVTHAVVWGSEEVSGRFDSIVSVGQLGSAGDLAALLGQLAGHADAETRLLFCEPTITPDGPTPEPPHDVTTTMWASGWSVIDCRRYRSGRGRRAHEYVWGRARLVLG